MHKFRELKVWQRSMDLIVEVHHADQRVNTLLQEADEIAAMIVGPSKSLSEK